MSAKRIAPTLATLITLGLTIPPAYTAESQGHKGQGTVNSVDAKAGKIKLTHGPVTSLKWPGMTMDFQVGDKEVLGSVKSGQKVEFTLTEKSRGRYVITEITPAK